MHAHTHVFIVPHHYINNIKTTSANDVIIDADSLDWLNPPKLQAHTLHYIGNDAAIFTWVLALSAQCLRWQPTEALDVSAHGLPNIQLHLILRAPFQLSCRDQSFAAIYLKQGCDYFAPRFSSSLPPMVLSTDKHSGRLPPLPALASVTHLSINEPWLAGRPGFDCRYLATFSQLQHLSLHGHMLMLGSLSQLSHLTHLRLSSIPDLSHFNTLSDCHQLQELTLVGCETEGSKQLNLAAKKLPELMVYFNSSVDRAQWQQQGYDYSLSQNDALQTTSRPQQWLTQTMDLNLDLNDLLQNNNDLASSKPHEPSLFERMRTEPVSEFFGFASKNDTEANTVSSSEAQPSLFERMRTESVTEFFRSNKDK